MCHVDAISIGIILYQDNYYSWNSETILSQHIKPTIVWAPHVQRKWPNRATPKEMFPCN